MTADRYQGNIITKSPTTPTGPYENGTAPGVWSLEEANEFTKAGVWPTAGNLPLNVDDLFNAHIYTGNGSTQTITTGMDITTDGGMVWLKNRFGNGYEHEVSDTERGVVAGGRALNTNDNNANQSGDLISFNSTGFGLDYNTANGNGSGQTYCAWTFRKAPKFFDIVGGLTSDSSGNLASFNHNLGSTPGMVLLKSTNSGSNWVVYHRGLSGSGANQYMYMQSTDGAYTNVGWATATDTTFTVNSGSLLVPSVDYIAYLFAHNDGDGEFGPNGDQDIIKCGSVVTDGSGNASVDVGFEPQWVFWKCADTLGGNEHGNWRINDVFRSYPVKDSAATFGYPKTLYSNTTDAEAINGVDGFLESATGFGFGQVQASKTYIYVAIRRGTKVPTSGTDVFQTQLYTGNGSTQLYDLDITPDMVINISRNINGDARAINDRLRQQAACLELYTDGSGSQYNGGANVGMEMDFTEKVQVQSYRITSSEPYLNYIFKRAPNAFDITSYVGNGSKQSVSHSLAVAPEMMWIKVRNTTQHWAVYHPDIPGSGKFLSLNNDWDGNNTNSTFWDGETPTATTFSVGATGVNNAYVNGSGNYYVAYLFATLAGVTKVGSYTGNGSNQTIDCGFTSGARFVLIKRTDTTGNWYVWDSERGIVAGNDPHLDLNTTTVEVTSDDSLDPDSSGFIVNQVSATNVNVSSGTYIFYAIA